MGRTSFAVRMVTAFVLFCSVLAPLITVTPATARDVPAEVDLAAISLTTADLDAAGFGRYMIGASEMNDIEYFPYWTELEIGLSIEEQIQALEDFGFLRAHSVFYFGPRDPGETISRSQIVTTIALYEDSDGAEAAYDLFEDASNSPSNTELRGWDDFGDRSQGLNEDASDGRSGMMISVLLDNLVFRFYTYFPEDEHIDEDAFADLIDVALERTEIGREAEQPALSNLVLRFDGLWAWRDLYMWRDGVMNRYVNQTEDVEYYAEEAESVGETEHFSMGTLLNAEETADNSEFVWQRVGLRRYEDEDAAETRFAEMLDSLANDEGFEAFDLVDVDFGDESFSYDAIWSESYPYHESYVYARYGEIILIFGFEAPVPTRDALDSIIDAQIDCFEDGDCLDRIPLTREVIALIDGDVVVDDATVESDEDDSDDQDGETESRDKGNITFPSNDDDADDGDADGRDTSLDTFTSEPYDFSVGFDAAFRGLSSQPQLAISP